jgi:2-phospho-L-lactate/phosphoenolpyruvate guanylyltransferase
VGALQSADLSRIWAIVPIRGLATAKTRLRRELDPVERLVLVTEMLRRTLEATRDAESIAGTIVVTMDPAAAGMASAHHAIGLVDRLPGLNEAIRAARSLAVAHEASAVLVVPADLARVSAANLDGFVALAQAAIESGSEGASGLVALVPDRHGEGTNALLVSPPVLVEPAFGPGSRLAHGSSALAARATYFEIGGPLTLDVDTVADFLLAEAALTGEEA